jgi:hypothetical protein
MFPVQPPARIEGVVLRGGCGCADRYVHKLVIRDEYQHRQEKGASMALVWEDTSVHPLDNLPEIGCFSVQWHIFPALAKHENEENDSSGDVEDSDGVL